MLALLGRLLPQHQLRLEGKAPKHMPLLLRVRVSAEFKRRLGAACEELGVEMSDYIRDVVGRQLEIDGFGPGSGSEPAPPPQPHSPPSPTKPGRAQRRPPRDSSARQR